MSRPPSPRREPLTRRAAVRFRATSVQRGMIVDSLRAPVPGVDVIQVVLSWPGRLDRTAFAACWESASARHDTLRSTFHWHRDQGVHQEVHDTLRPSVRWVHLDPEQPVRQQVDAFIGADRVRGFDLAAGPLLRVTVLSGRSTDHTIVVTFHHAIVDGRSIVVLLREVFSEYDEKDDVRLGGRTDRHPEIPSFQRFADWWEQQDRTPAREFWQSYLSDLPSARPLTGHLGRPPAALSDPVTLEATLTRAESDTVHAGAAKAGVPTSAVVHAAWGLLMARHTDAADVVFAVTRSCRWRTVEAAERIVGPLINTVPLRLRLDPDHTARQLLAEVRARALENREHQVAPLAEVLEWAGQQADASRIESLVVVERATLQARLHETQPMLRRTRIKTLRQLSFPLSLYVFDEPEIRLDLTLDQRRFDRAAAEEIFAQFRHTLVALARDRDALVREIGLEPADRPTALHDVGHAPLSAYPRDETIPTLFAAQVKARPNAPALTADGATWSYAELDERSERLARVLRRHGVGTDRVVAVAVPRSADLIITLLAVVKAGGTYLPLDPDSPPNRTGTLLADAGARVVVTTDLWDAELPSTDATTLRLPLPEPDNLLSDADPLGAHPLGAHQLGAHPLGAHPLGAAYINYTSGSTGAPKGVAVPHRAVVRLVHEPNFATLGPSEVLLHYAPAAFDATTWEIWGALLTGAHLVVAPPGPLDLAALGDVIRESGISTLWLTAGLFSQLVELDVGALSGVRQVLAGGDILDPNAVRAALRTRPGKSLVNGYGPTENTTFTTCHHMRDADEVPDRVPIGRPVQQTSVYVLDEHLRPVPIGVTGEVYTGGDGLARGYAGQPAQTAEKFVPDPYTAVPGGRMYRTGDLARWRADGVLEFVGRVDDQVKIRGFRVEPREVEAVMCRHAAVREAAVVVRGDGLGRHLVAYVTPRPNTDGMDTDGIDTRGMPRPELLREYAGRRLPSYLVPSSVVVLERFPLRPNGKVDRAALPDAQPLHPGSAEGLRTPTERRLATLWAELLPGGPVGVDDDFFAAGGNSLAAIRLTFRIGEEFGVQLGLPEFYGASTLAACARAIDDAQPEAGNDERAGTRAPHRIPLTDEWALWRDVCLRSAGLPFDLVDGLADPAIAALADRANARRAEQAAYLAAFPAATTRLSRALVAAGRDSRLREAIAWQNRHALSTGVDPLLRREPATVNRNRRHRQHEALLGSYLQRYCAKNDTIGFFGPIGWSRFDESARSLTVRRADRELSSRTVHLGGWAVTGLLNRYETDLRPDLVPRRLPHVAAVDGTLRVPLGPDIALSAIEQAVVGACDGRRTAREIGESIGRDLGFAEPAVYETMAALAADRRIAWRLEVPPDDVEPERSARALLVAAAPSAARSAALAALDELESARDALATAAGDADAVASAVADLEGVYVRHTNASPSRRPGELYAGRTIAYEECRLGASVEFGATLLDGIREALGAVLTGARWFTAASAALYSRLLRDVFDARAAATGAAAVPFADLWMLVTDLLFNPPADLVRPLTRGLAQRWATVLQLPSTDGHRVELTSAGLMERAQAAFGAAGPGWPAAVHHSPDLMLLPADEAALRRGDVDWVLGELHPGVNTLRYQALVAQHDSPDALRAAMAADIAAHGTGPAVWAASTAEPGGVPARQSNRLAAAADPWLVFAHDTVGVDGERALQPAELDVVDLAGTLRVRSRDGLVDLSLIEVLGDLIAGAMIQHFRVVPRVGDHTPRVQIDRLVVSRESWSFPAAELPFAHTTDEAHRFQEVRAWAAAHELPRRLFVRGTGEPKPLYLDLTSLVSVDLLCRAVRRAGKAAGPAARIDLTEMLPGPDQLWLTDGKGRRHTAELRVVAADQRDRS